MADKLNGILISEILADNAGGGAVDTDGDGATNKADEFIELQNATGTTVSLDGYQLWSDKGGLLYSFGPSDTIAPGGTATVVGNYTGTPPAGFYSAGVSESTNWLPDGEGPKFETIYLVDTATGEFIRISYGNPPQPPAPPTGFPGTTLVGAGEAIDSNAPNATSILRDANGDLIEGTPTPGTPGVPCFLAGTRIATEAGFIAVENIAPGMRVMTIDQGLQPVRGIRAVRVNAFMQLRAPTICPVTFPAGTFGDHDTLTVSPAHRIILRGSAVHLLSGGTEAFAAAAQCIGFGGIRQAGPGGPFTYVHLLLDDHQVIQANGLWAESLFLGDLVHPMLAEAAGWQFDPGIDPADLHHARIARPMLNRHEVAVTLRDLLALQAA